MKSLLCVVPALLDNESMVATKIAALVASSQQPCHIVVHAKKSTVSRFSFLQAVNIDAAELYEQALQTWLHAFETALAEAEVAYQLTLVSAASCEQKVLALQVQLSPAWLLLFHRGALTDDQQAVIHRSQSPVLVLDTIPWKTPAKVVAAIDPFHHRDTTADTDKRIVQQGRRLSRVLKAKLQLVHCQYMPSYLAKHRTAINSYYSNAMAEFVQLNQLEDIPLKVLRGEPLATLSHYIKSHETDFLVLGLSSRSALDRAVTGSTAEPLLKKLPCELLVLPVVKASH